MQRESRAANRSNPAESFNFQYEERIEVDGRVQYKTINEVCIPYLSILLLTSVALVHSGSACIRG